MRHRLASIRPWPVLILLSCGRTTLDDAGAAPREPSAVADAGDTSWTVDADVPGDAPAQDAALADAPPPSVTEFVTSICIEGASAGSDSLSRDGRFLAYLEAGVIRVLDRRSGETQMVAIVDNGHAPAISGDGSRVAYERGPGNTRQAFVWDRVVQSEVGSYYSGDAARGVLDFTGRTLVFDSRLFYAYGCTTLAEIGSAPIPVCVNDRGDIADEGSSDADVSDDAQRIVFASVASNLVSGKPARRRDVYLRDRAAGTTVLVNRTPDGGYPAERGEYTYSGKISGDGTTVLFDSLAANLVPGDTPATPDVFLYDVATQRVTSFTVGVLDAVPSMGTLSRDGRFVLFSTKSRLLDPRDTNDATDAFVYDAARGDFELVSRGYWGEPLTLGAAGGTISGDGNTVLFQTRSPELADDSALCIAERRQGGPLCLDPLFATDPRCTRHATGCGDGVLSPREECDDDNLVSGDGCSATCTIEVSWNCAVPGAPCERNP